MFMVGAIEYIEPKNFLSLVCKSMGNAKFSPHTQGLNLHEKKIQP